MFCPDCGAQHAEGSRFCPQCGAPVGPDPVPSMVDVTTESHEPVLPASPLSAAARPAPAARASTGIGRLVLFGLVMMLIGGAGVYVLLSRSAGRGPAGLPTPSQSGMQSYSDPQGRFTIQYPQGWRVSQEGQARRFSRDDPSKPPAAFIVAERKTMPGELTGEQVLDRFLADDLGADAAKITNRTVHPGAIGQTIGEAASIDVLGTIEGGPMHAKIVLEARHPGDGTTIAQPIAYMARPEEFAALDPLFQRMVKSYREP